MLQGSPFLSNQSCCSTMELVIDGNVDPGYNLEMLPKEFSYNTINKVMFDLCSADIPFYDDTDFDEKGAICASILQQDQTSTNSLQQFPQGYLLHDTRFFSKSFYRQFDGNNVPLAARTSFILLVSSWRTLGEISFFQGGFSLTLTENVLVADNYTYLIQASEFDCGFDNVNITFVDMPDSPISGSLRCKEPSSSSNIPTALIVIIPIALIILLGLAAYGYKRYRMAGSFSPVNLL